jgi:hypothetical protein
MAVANLLSYFADLARQLLFRYFPPHRTAFAIGIGTPVQKVKLSAARAY